MKKSVIAFSILCMQAAWASQAPQPKLVTEKTEAEKKISHVDVVMEKFMTPGCSVQQIEEYMREHAVGWDALKNHADFAVRFVRHGLANVKIHYRDHSCDPGNPFSVKAVLLLRNRIDIRKKLILARGTALESGFGDHYFFCNSQLTRLNGVEAKMRIEKSKQAAGTLQPPQITG